MSASIRGHQAVLKFYRDGGALELLNLTKVNIQQDSSFSRSFYLGQAQPEGDQSIEGWSGTVDAEVKDSSMDDLIDALIEQNLAGIGVQDHTMVHTENYADGSSKSWVYYDMQFKMSKDQGGLNEKMTKRLDFQASGRRPL